MHCIPSWLHEPSNDTKRILFARHGQYLCNVEHRSNGNPRNGYFLTDLGREQAIALGRRLASEGIEAVVTSEYQRARETAYWVNQTLGLPQLVNRLANEITIGPELEGKPVNLFNNSFEADPVNIVNCEGGESYALMRARFVNLISDLVLSSPRTILVVTHGWALQIARELKGEITAEQGARCVGMPANCEVVELICDSRGAIVPELQAA